ncbi:polysaccharide biosynthesis C-terminal domain-containing protein [Sinomonas susongensis]|uniref:oligosaccharide flippase family protein n=1 Tax=Sinomonas susongensis TaxID=1324851 RepID=UPI001485D303|nr:polysaccharide biosynthesis C-terminal domain-containing protein [Sinomonas susongensis]
MGRQATSLAAATGVAQGLLALLYILAARGSGPEALGSAVSAVALATAGVGFIDFGTNSHWVREIARGTLSLGEFSSRLTGKIVAATGLAAVWTTLMLLFDRNSLSWTAGPIMLCLLINQSLQVSLRAAARGELVAIAILSDRMVALSLFAVLTVAHFNGAAVIWVCLCCGSVTASVVGFRLTKRTLRPNLRAAARINPWRGASFYGLATLANTSQALDLPVLSLAGGATAAGIYGAVNRWTQPMSLLANAFSTAAAPLISRAGNIVDAWKHLRKAMWMLAAAIVLSGGIAVASPLIIELLLGASYEDSIAALRLLAVATIFSIVAQPLSVVLQSLGRDRFVAGVLAGAVLIQLALVMALGSQLRATGAAISYLVVEVLQFIAMGIGAYVEYRRGRVDGV